MGNVQNPKTSQIYDENTLATDAVIRLIRIAGWENDDLDIDIVSGNVETNTFIESREFAYVHGAGITNFFIGRRSYINGGGILSPNTIIGRYCSISNSTSIGPTRHRMEWLSTGLLPPNAVAAKAAQESPVYTVVGSDVWIGFGATIIGGVRIGHGACIGAGAVVTHDVAPYTVVAGVPAKPLRKRFPADIIAALLATKWWTLSEQIIALLPYDDIEACVRFLENL